MVTQVRHNEGMSTAQKEQTVRHNTTDNRYLDAALATYGDRTHATKPGTGKSLCGAQTTGRLTHLQPLTQITCKRCRKSMAADGGKASAQMLADKLRDKYTFKGENADLNDEKWNAWLDQISVYPNGSDFLGESHPAVIFETDTEWAFSISSFDFFESQGMPYYFEPYYSFAVQIFSTEF